jgi:hypothetical protein
MLLIIGIYRYMIRIEGDREKLVAAISKHMECKILQ